MNSRQIHQLLRSHLSTRRVIVGVYASDVLPSKPRAQRPCAYIVNLDPHHLPGSHWVCCYFPKDTYLPEYFDSYGQLPSSNIVSFLNAPRYLRSTATLQNLFSTVCGQYCMYYLWKRIQDCDMASIVEHLRRMTPPVADEFVNACVERVFGQDLDVYDEDFLSNQIATAFRVDHG